ncbi:MAG: hypothetical protein KKF12_02610 [Proteobacteria bacterium]|nr:hypothetical protein [Desulfobacula sp.]MBU3951604.1 hypothetical protein [Pseudomonadota bacterium]MBU4129693.1 hypothetical protein [Pseudomonadota bacterium]
MGTRYLFEKAIRISQRLTPPEKQRVKNLCNEIKQSQEALLDAADRAMFNCIEKCRGLCCKSLDIDSIFSLWDFIFILTLDPGRKEDIRKRLKGYSYLYLSPCPFLEGSVGPCIFRDTIKAQICVITFCANDEKIRKPINRVNTNFYKLCWLIQYLRLKRIALKMGRIFSVAGSFGR